MDMPSSGQEQWLYPPIPQAVCRLERDVRDPGAVRSEHIFVDIAHHVVTKRHQDICCGLDAVDVSIVPYIEGGRYRYSDGMLNVLLDMRTPNLHRSWG